MITAAFGQILTQEVLDIPKYGCINVHASLLPKYRGASPIQAAIIYGETVTGITTMLTDIGLDTGDILLQREIEIQPDETAGELTQRLAVLGSEVLKDTIIALENGTLKRIPQDHSTATKCRTIKKSMAKMDFTKSAKRCTFRSRNESIAHSVCKPQRCRSQILQNKAAYGYAFRRTPGTVIIASPKQGLFIAAGEGVLEVLEMQYLTADAWKLNACSTANACLEGI